MFDQLEEPSRRSAKDKQRLSFAILNLYHAMPGARRELVADYGKRHSLNEVEALAVLLDDALDTEAADRAARM